MNNNEINNINFSSRTFSFLYGNQKNPSNHNNIEKYKENNVQNYISNNYNNNINNLSPLPNTQFYNQNINNENQIVNVNEQKYINDVFKQRMNYLKNNDINNNKNEFPNSKNSSMTYTETTARSHLNLNNSNLYNNFNKLKDISIYGYYPNTNIYNTIENTSEQNLDNNQLKSNQILFLKNMESLKNIKFNKNEYPITSYNYNNKILYNNDLNLKNNSIKNDIDESSKIELNNKLNSEKIKQTLKTNNIKTKLKSNNSTSNPVSKNKITKKKITKKSKNSIPSNINIDKFIDNNSFNLNNQKKYNKNKINSNSTSKIPIQKINLKKEESKNDKLHKTEREDSNSIKSNLEKEFRKYKEKIEKMKENENNEEESETEKDFEPIQYPKYKHISSLDEISKFPKDEQIKRLFHYNLQLYQELNDLRNENSLLRKELNKKKIKKGNINNDDKFKNFILDENEKLNKINRTNEKILDGFIEKINEIIKEKNIKYGKDDNSNIINYNELIEEPDKTKYFLDNIFSSYPKKKNMRNKSENNPRINHFKSGDYTLIKNQIMNNNNYFNNDNDDILKDDNLNFKNNNNNFHHKSNSMNTIKYLNDIDNNDNENKFYDYYNLNGKDRTKNCYACLFGHSNYTKGYSPLLCFPNKENILKEQQEKTQSIQNENE